MYKFWINYSKSKSKIQIMKGKNSQCLTQASPSETTKLVSGKLFNRQLAGQCDGSQNWLHPPHTHLQLIYLFPIFFSHSLFFSAHCKEVFLMTSFMAAYGNLNYFIRLCWIKREPCTRLDNFMSWGDFKIGMHVSSRDCHVKAWWFYTAFFT